MSAGRVPRFGHGSRVPGWDREAHLSKDAAVVPDAATTPVPAELRERIEGLMARYPNWRSATIPALHAAQDLHGWLSEQAIAQVAAVMQVTPAWLLSVASFYDMFKTEPAPRDDVFVCTNISCSLRGADTLLAAIQEVAPDSVGVRGFECLGACDIAPMASVNGEYIGPLEPADAVQIIEDLQAGRPVLEHKQLRRRACADPAAASTSTSTSAPKADKGPEKKSKKDKK